eukprot:5193914-Amphidinium_carterae.1
MQERVWLPLPGLKHCCNRFTEPNSWRLYVPLHEECHPHEGVSDCKGVVKATCASPANGKKNSQRAQLNALRPGQRIRWMKAHQKQADVVTGRMTAEDFHGNGQAYVLAKQGTAQHGPPEPDATWLSWTDFATIYIYIYYKVYHLWRLVRPHREHPDDELRARLPAEPAVAASAVPVSEQALSEAPFQLGPHKRVVR